MQEQAGQVIEIVQASGRRPDRFAARREQAQCLRLSQAVLDQFEGQARALRKQLGLHAIAQAPVCASFSVSVSPKVCL